MAGKSEDKINVDVARDYVKISFGSGDIKVPMELLPELSGKLMEARKLEISRLQERINKLALIGSAEASSSSPPVAVDAVETGVSGEFPTIKNKTYITGQCYTCDKKINSNQGQPCAYCKRTSHKKCLDHGICGTCLDSTDED